MTSLNTDSPKRTISDLEALLLTCDKLIQHKIDEGAKGQILCKGAENEKKLSYKKAHRLINELYALFNAEGTFSFGCCDTCTKFDRSCHGSPEYGTCKVNKQSKHKFMTCDHHSAEGSGFAIR